MGFGIGNEVVGKTLRMVSHQVGQHLAQPQRHGLFANAGLDPSVQAIGPSSVVPGRPRRLRKTPGGVTGPASMVSGSAKKYRSCALALATVMFRALPSCRPGTPHALHIVGLRRWDRTEDHRGKIADVDAHFQGRRAGKQVRVPGPTVRPLEPFLQFLAHLPAKKTGVLGGKDALHVSVGVQIGIVVWRCAFNGVGTGAMQPAAGPRRPTGRHLRPPLTGCGDTSRSATGLPHHQTTKASGRRPQTRSPRTFRSSRISSRTRALRTTS